jgi:hypothetical protein
MLRRIISGIVMTIPLVIWGCSDEYGISSQPVYRGTFFIEAKYDYIRSQVGGGGIFLVRMMPGSNFDGTVDLELLADPCLHAHLDRTTLDQASSSAEITVAPDNKAEFKTYQIEVRAAHKGDYCSVYLNVEILQWPCGTPDGACRKMTEFLEWVKEKYPHIRDLSSDQWTAFLTYPQILIVEHWTFLSPEWEIRMCHHVMIPPYDWTYFRLRKRDEFDPALAARRDTENMPLHEIPVEDYPIMYGY